MFRFCALVATVIFVGACSSSRDHSGTATQASIPPTVIGSSSSSSSSSGVPVIPEPPSVPEDLRAEVNDTQILYSWAPVDGAAEYILYYSTEPDVTPSDTTTRWVRTRASQLVLDGYKEQDYFVVVTAVAPSGVESAPSKQLQTRLSTEPLMVLDFEDQPIGSEFESQHTPENRDLLIQTSDASTNHYLGATYVPTSIGSPRLRFVREFTPGRSYTVNYRVFFEVGFDFAKGGKLPGLSPRYPATGCEDRGPGSWSVRLMWMPQGGVSVYYYDQELVAACGKTAKAWNFYFERGRWYDIALFVKLNTSYLKDGQITLYIDGVEMVNRTNLKLRAIDGVDTEIQKLLFSTFFGGSSSDWSPSGPVKARFDQFEVYRGLRVR